MSSAIKKNGLLFDSSSLKDLLSGSINEVSINFFRSFLALAFNS